MDRPLKRMLADFDRNFEEVDGVLCYTDTALTLEPLVSRQTIVNSIFGLFGLLVTLAGTPIIGTPETVAYFGKPIEVAVGSFIYIDNIH